MQNCRPGVKYLFYKIYIVYIASLQLRVTKTLHLLSHKFAQVAAIQLANFVEFGELTP